MREFTAAIAEFTESPTSPRFSLIPRASVQLQSEEHTAGLFLSQSSRLGRRFVQTLNHLTTTDQFYQLPNVLQHITFILCQDSGDQTC